MEIEILPVHKSYFDADSLNMLYSILYSGTYQITRCSNESCAKLCVSISAH